MSEFNQKVYEIVRRIPVGKVMTYGQIAALIGVPRAARAVGYALHWVDESQKIPCQRVVNRFGGLAAGYGWGGQQAHKADLLVEGFEVKDDFTVDLAKYQWFPGEGELPTNIQLSPEGAVELDNYIKNEGSVSTRAKKSK